MFWPAVRLGDWLAWGAGERFAERNATISSRWFYSVVPGRSERQTVSFAGGWVHAKPRRRTHGARALLAESLRSTLVLPCTARMVAFMQLLHSSPSTTPLRPISRREGEPRTGVRGCSLCGVWSVGVLANAHPGTSVPGSPVCDSVALAFQPEHNPFASDIPS